MFPSLVYEHRVALPFISLQLPDPDRIPTENKSFLLQSNSFHIKLQA